MWNLYIMACKPLRSLNSVLKCYKHPFRHSQSIGFSFRVLRIFGRISEQQKSKVDPAKGQTMGRAPCCSKIGLNRGAWTEKEDQILCDYIKTHGEGNWRNLPKNAGLKRCGKSCRLRWMNYLRPDIKRGNISEEEEELIVRLHKLLGNRWSLIAGRLPGRTDNEIKNYWNTHLSKKLQLPDDSRPRIRRTRKPKPSPEGDQPMETILDKTVPPKLHTGVKEDSNISGNKSDAEMDVSMSWQELLISSFSPFHKEHANLKQDADVVDVENLLDFNDCEDLSSPSDASPGLDALGRGSLFGDGDALHESWIDELGA